MPELPEVETIKQGMIKKVKGKRIEKIEIKNGKNIRILSPPEFQRRVERRVLKDIKRRGKFLILYLDSEDLLIFHLKLTGRLLFAPQREKEPDYVRIVFIFTDKSVLFFTDIRGFADVFLLPQKELESIPAIKNMGPEPLSPDFTVERFKERLRGKRGKIKPLLMDQSVLAGVGNIYSQEALYRAGVHPERDVSRLSEEELEAIYRELIKVLEEALRHRGSSVDAYVDLDGKEGNFVPRLQVYGREGKNCGRCGFPIKKKKIAGRGTYFCSQCQK